MRRFLLTVLTPAIKIIGKIKSPWSHKKAINYYYDIENLIEPLDIILTNTRGHLSNLFNPGKYKHALIYIGKENSIPMVIEAIGKGVVKRPLVVCISEKDMVAVVRANKKIFKNKLDIKEGVKFAEENVGKGYDYMFDMKSSHKFTSFYCSELCYYTLKKAGVNFKFKLRKTLGVDTVIPMDFYNAKNKFDIIFEIKKNGNKK